MQLDLGMKEIEYANNGFLKLFDLIIIDLFVDFRFYKYYEKLSYIM